MQNIIENLSCLQCRQEYNIKLPEICKECAAKEVFNRLYEQSKIREQIDKKYFWKGKIFAWHMLLYFPLCVFIGLKFGFDYEMFWIVGGLWTIILPYLRDWLASKF